MGRSSVASQSQSPVRERPVSASKSKLRDPVEDALDIKRRQREAQQRMLEKRLEKEMQECSFSPSISHVSRELAESNPYRRAAPLHERTIGHVTTVWEDTKAAEKVKMNETSRILAASVPGRDVPIGERAVREMNSFAERMKKQAEQKQQKEILETTHAPKIDKGSSKIVAKRAGAPDAMGRLTDEYLRKREEARDRLKREAEDKMAQALAKPTYVNKQSERLLQRAADSGREIKGIDAGSKTPRTMASTEYNQRFDNEYGSAAPTPRGGTSRSHSRATSPLMTPRTPRSSLTRTTPARELVSSSARNTKSKSPNGSPDSPPQKLAFTTPLAHLGATSRTGGRGHDSNQDDTICSANPNSIGDCASDIKWMARMSGKSNVEPRPRSRAASPARALRTASSGFNPFGEMDKMRLEFQRLMREKEEETKMLLEQIITQKVEASNGELMQENERLRDELELQIERVSVLEMTVEESRAGMEEMEAEREQLRKANEKLRLDLEAITEKGQAVVELNGKLMVQIKALKSKASGKSKHIKVDVQSDKTEVQVKPIELPSQADDKVGKKFADFLDDSDDSEAEQSSP